MNPKFLLILFFTINTTVFSQTVILKELDCKVSNEGKYFISKIIEHEYNYFESFLDIPRDTELKVSIYGNHETFKTTQKLISRSTTNSAFYSKKHKQIFINYRKKRGEERLLNVIAHESSHLILYTTKNIKSTPKWISEGYSEYFEQAKLVANKIEIEPIQKYVTFIHTNFEKKHIKIPKFLSWSNAKWKNINKNHIYSYKVSWAIINYLMKEKKELLKTITLEVLKNPTKSVKIFNAIYPGGVNKLQDDMIVYYENMYKNLSSLRNQKEYEKELH